MGWRHGLADTANFDRGLSPAEGDPVLDLAALRYLSPYGLVAMACLAAHNDRLLVQTKVVPPAHPLTTAELLAAGFGFVVREFLCPVAGPPLPLPPTGAGAAAGRGAEPLASGSLPSGPLAYGPLAAAAPGRRAPVVRPPALSLRPVHDGFEEDAVAEEASGALAGSVIRDRVALIVGALRLLGENRRRHAGAFDAYVAAAVVDGGSRGPMVELAVGDGGMGLRAALAHQAGTAAPAPPAGGGAGSVGDEVVSAPPEPPVDDAAAVDRVLQAGGSLAELAQRVTAEGGTVVVRSGDARHTVCSSGIVRARVPWLRGTLVAVSMPTGVPKVPALPRVRQLPPAEALVDLPAPATAEGPRSAGALVDAG